MSSPSDPLLSGLKVLDFTRVLAGPFATMVMADLGAQVVKVELPGQGDDSRGFGPFVGDRRSAYFLSVNRGKQSVTLDLRTDAGRDLALRLAEQSDVLVENFRPGSMDRFGLGYEQVAARNRRIVYASVSGFGQTGPYAHRPAYDVIVQAMSGLASITGLPGQPPVRVGSSTADLNAALFAVIGIQACLARARSTGQGEHVDVSMLDCQVSLLENAIARYDVEGQVPGPLGSRHPTITPFQFFATAEGNLVIAAGNDRLWQRLCEVIDRPDLAKDPRFDNNALRTQNHSELEPELAAVFSQQTTAHWLELLEAAGVPCGPVNDIADVVDDPHIAQREMIRTQMEGDMGVRVPGPPLKFSNAPTAEIRPAPGLGEHTTTILSQWLGLAPSELDSLQEAGVV
ncbi:MAG: CoA transferase [Candidatus Latescibacterota bacterium]|nr:CoA transferase [Candidatus Latescibacterota bacterium]